MSSAKQPRRYTWKRMLSSIALIYGCVAIFVWFYSERLIFLPPAASYTLSDPYFAVDSPAGERIACRYYENPVATHSLILSHGNAEDMGNLTGLADLISALGVSVLIYDYPGYGASTGKPTEASACDGIDAAYQYLVGQRGIAPERVILYGRSVGSGPTMWLASRETVAAVLLESAFVSAFRVMTRWSLFPFDRFPNSKRMRTLKCPLLVMHGEKDSIIAPWHATVLHAVAPSEHKSLVVFRGAGHNDLQVVAGRDYPSVLRAFFASLNPIAGQ